MTRRMMNIDIANIYALWNEYAVALQENDLETWLTLWLSSGIQLAPGSQSPIPMDQLRAHMQSLFKSHIVNRMSIQIEEVRIRSDWAISHGRYRLHITPREGGNHAAVSGTLLNLFERQADGSWKISIECISCSEPCKGWITPVDIKNGDDSMYLVIDL